MQKQLRKNICVWALYDFANSLVWTGFLFFFSQWLVIGQQKPVWWYNLALVGASGLFIATAPFISRNIDVTGKKLPGLRIWTLLSCVMFALSASITLSTDKIDVVATAFFALGAYTYLVCLLYFTPMLNDLSTYKNRSKIAGIGQSANLFGQALILIISLPLVTGTITFLGESGYAQALLIAATLFPLLSLPMLISYKEKAHDSQLCQTNTLNESSPLLQKYQDVFRHKPLLFAILAFLLFGDAILTFASNFPLYLETVHNASDATKIFLTCTILIMASIGAVIFGHIAQKTGEIKMIRFIITGWCVLFILFAFVSDFKMLIPFFVVAGILYGPTFSLTRSLIGKLALRKSVATSFSLYVVAERFATFAGPAIWSMALIYKGESVTGYQTALVLMTSLVLLSFLITFKVNTEN